MQIQARVDQYHNNHGPDETCIYQFSRVINNKEFLFTCVSDKNKAWCHITELDVIGLKRHSFGGSRRAPRK